jgi:hypothetical protein
MQTKILQDKTKNGVTHYPVPFLPTLFGKTFHSHYYLQFVKFQVRTAARMKPTVFWQFAACSLLKICRRFRLACFYHHLSLSLACLPYTCLILLLLAKLWSALLPLVPLPRTIFPPFSACQTLSDWFPVSQTDYLNATYKV